MHDEAALCQLTTGDDRVTVIIKMILNATKCLLELTDISKANGIWGQHYELSKQLYDLHIDVALLSETHL
jgi:hypothetical protein